MSYEGYEQHICTNGHRFNTDSYLSFKEAKCDVCERESVFYNAVDDTNCDSYGVIPEEAWSQFLLTEEEVKTCDMGHSHIVKHATYRIPTKEELIEVRHYWDYINDKLVPLKNRR